MKFQDSFLARYNMFMIFLVLTLGALYIGKDFLRPLAWALFLALLLRPLAAKLEGKWIGRGMASIIMVASLVIVFFLFVGLFSYEIVSFSGELTNIEEKLKDAVKNINGWIEQATGFKLSEQLKGQEKLLVSLAGSAGSWLVKELGGIGSSFTKIILTMIYLFFILYYRRLVKKFIDARFSNRNQEKVDDFIKRSVDVIQGYINGTLIITLVLAVLCYVIFLLFGIKHAIFLALLVALSNLIPYIGNFISFIVVFLLVWITKDSFGIAIGVLACLYGANLLQENVARPWFVGTQIDVNAFVVFISVVLGGIFWGLSGMILFIPLAGIVKIVFQLSEKYQPYAILFGSDGDENNSKAKKTQRKRKLPGS